MQGRVMQTLLLINVWKLKVISRLRLPVFDLFSEFAVKFITLKINGHFLILNDMKPEWVQPSQSRI